MFELFLMALSGGAVWAWFHFKNARERVDRWEAFARPLRIEDAGAAFDECSSVVTEHFRRRSASPFAASFIENKIECAVACASRINEINGHEFGPNFCKSFHIPYIQSLAAKAEKLA